MNNIDIIPEIKEENEGKEDEDKEDDQQSPNKKQRLD